MKLQLPRTVRAPGIKLQERVSNWPCPNQPAFAQAGFPPPPPPPRISTHPFARGTPGKERS